ncbi:MAG TPA: hypothetical protein VK177_13805, partial [Flavobacteriales bacterium]|nr:hypothetical protein [Flavobacteriales bacterium]
MLKPVNKIITAVLLTCFVVAGCNYTKRLSKGEYLVEKNTIEVKGDKISQGELQAVLKTQPNRKIFGKPRFHLWLYNIPDTVKMHHKTKKKQARIKRKNEKRVKKGKEPKPLKKSWKERRGNWIRNSVGEAPVLLDSAKVRSSTKNLRNYLFKKGYFNNTVRDSIGLDSVHKKAYLYYFVTTRTPYTIDTFTISSEDKKLLKVIKSASDETLIKEDDRLDIDVLDAERSRLITYLKDRGYYDMSKDFFTFKIDSTLGSQRVKLNMSVARLLRKDYDSDSTWYENHRRYLVNNIYIFTDYINNDSLVSDTSVYKDEEHEYIIVYHGRPSIRPSNLSQHIYINRGYYYRAKEVESTYKKLTSLGIYKSTNIVFKPNVSDPSNPVLDAYIYLKPQARQTFKLEAKGTNRGGNLGIAGDLTYRNKNLFRGAEALKITMTGGIEAQQLLTNQDESTVGGNIGVGEFKPLNTFNTIEFGPEISLTIPKFLVPFNVFKFSKNASPKTVFTADFNFQQRPDFTRGIQEASLGYEWLTEIRKKTQKKEEKPIATMSHYLSPLKLSAVKINPSDDFKTRLNTIKDPYLKYSYTDHILLGCQYQMQLNINRKNPNKDQIYIKWGIEQSGNLLRQVFSWSNQPVDTMG